MVAVANSHVYTTLSRYYLTLPHCQAIGLTLEDTEGRNPILSVAWRGNLVGNAHNRVLHGGVITTLVDVASATAVSAHMAEFETLATLDMRIDYLHAATPEKTVYAKSECFRLSGQVAFVRTTCYHADQPQHPIALGTATFMRTPIPAHLQERIQ